MLVCQGRAVAHGRLAPDQFDDPTAMALLRADEQAPVERARAGVAPPAAADRMEYEILRASAEVMVPRTVAIDEAVRARPTPQLVILGAGLDGRAWRMLELATVRVFEVDHPLSQEDKRRRTAGLPSRARLLRFVPTDFRSAGLNSALDTAGHLDTVATTWIWEGVVPYLTPTEVAATVTVVRGRSAPGSRLIVNYQAPALAATAGRLVARAMALASRRTDPLADEPRRSSWTPDAMRKLLAAHALQVVSDDDLLTLAERLSLDVRARRSLAAGRIAVADR